MEIAQQLTLLAELSSVEQKLKAANEKVESLYAEAKRAEADAADKKVRVDDVEKKHQQVEMARRNLESELAAEKDKLRKWQARADQIRGEREHAALASEIGAQKRSITHLENDILEKMQEQEDLGAELAKATGERDAAEKRVAEEHKKVEGDAKAAKAEAEQHDKARRAMLEKLPVPLVKRYERIVEKRGTAVAILTKEMCTACKRTLPPQLCIQIYKGVVLETCPSCQRILVHEAMTRAPEGEATSAPAEGASP